MAVRPSEESLSGFDPDDLEAGSHAHSDSVLEFKDMTFLVNNKKTNGKKVILQQISGKVESGHILAVLGPSGAGKTVFINALTLNATSGGRVEGYVALNGMPLTSKTMRDHCFVVPQEDNHWPMLTCRETMQYAADLYMNASSQKKKAKVNEILAKMGLESCADTRVGNEFIKGLSGGQKRRLSIAIAMIKEPSVIFLDEPTSGLDAAAAANIMEFIRDLAAQDNLIIVATIHQPSARVYEGFDQMMLLSKGRCAYLGKASDAEDYFKSIGHETPSNMGAAEFFLDLVNADFTEEKEVDKVLDTWQSKKEKDAIARSSLPVQPSEMAALHKPGFMAQVKVMFRRHTTIALRDPTLFLGRCAIFIFTCLFFSIIYIKQRERDQDQVLNKVWLSIWFLGVPTNMGVVAVWAYNAEFKAVRREVKNGMVRPSAYLIASSLIQLPVMFLFAICALGIPGYAVGNFYAENLGTAVIIYAVCMYAFESFAQVFSITHANPLLGMLDYVNIWFTTFLFSGFLIFRDDIVWPFRAFAYVNPLYYTIRSLVYNEFIDSTWESCSNLTEYAVCYGDPTKDGPQDGGDVLVGLSRVMPNFDDENTVFLDIAITLAIGVLFKLIHIILLNNLATKSSKIHTRKSSLSSEVVFSSN